MDQNDEVQNTTTEDLLEMINEMPSIGSEMVTVPMTDDMYEMVRMHF